MKLRQTLNKIVRKEEPGTPRCDTDTSRIKQEDHEARMTALVRQLYPGMSDKEIKEMGEFM